MSDPIQLAIVIPAYKGKFLSRTLASIAAQTDRRFRLYIGDDASPEPLDQVAHSAGFGDKQCLYHRFESNLGGQALAQHWNRCVALTREPWIWLFSDDDLMDAQCVAKFYEALEGAGSGFKVFRFQTVAIDEHESVRALDPPHPPRETALEFAYFRMRSLRSSFMQQVILSRDALVNGRGFVDFPMAWASDDATIISLAREGGIFTISGPCVRFRFSGVNISSRRDRRLSQKKLEAALAFGEWLTAYLERQTGPEAALLAPLIKRHLGQWLWQHCEEQRRLFSPAEITRVSARLSPLVAGTKSGLQLRLWRLNLQQGSQRVVRWLRRGLGRGHPANARDRHPARLRAKDENPVLPQPKTGPQ